MGSAAKPLPAARVTSSSPTARTPCCCVGSPRRRATADRMAKGRLKKIADGFVTAEMELIGDPRLRPEAQIELQKVGAQIDGIYRVDRARHRFDKHGYLVNVKAVRISVPPPAAQPQPPPPQQQSQSPQAQPAPSPQAQAMRQAAQSGAPFCEECAAARQAAP